MCEFEECMIIADSLSALAWAAQEAEDDYRKVQSFVGLIADSAHAMQEALRKLEEVI